MGSKGNNAVFNSVHGIRWEFVSALHFSVHQGLHVGAGSTKWCFTAPNTQKPVDVGGMGECQGDQGVLV